MVYNSIYTTRSLHSIPRHLLRVKTGVIEIWSTTQGEETPLEAVFVIPLYFLGMFAENLMAFQKILKDTYKNVLDDMSKPPEIKPLELEFGNLSFLDGKRCTMELATAENRVIRLNYGAKTTDITQASDCLILMRVRISKYKRILSSIKSNFH